MEVFTPNQISVLQEMIREAMTKFIGLSGESLDALESLFLSQRQIVETACVPIFEDAERTPPSFLARSGPKENALGGG